MRLSAEANESDVEEALRLFRVSTLTASKRNDAVSGANMQQVKNVEDALRRRRSATGRGVPSAPPVSGRRKAGGKRAVALRSVTCAVIPKRVSAMETSRAIACCSHIVPRLLRHARFLG